MDGSNVESSGQKSTSFQNTLTFEEALSTTKFGLLNCILIVISGTILAAFLLETLGISYVIAVAECDLQLSSQEMGILSAVGFAGVIVSSHLWGFLADTKGRRKVIMPTLFLSFTLTVISSFATSFWYITICRFLVGFFISGSSATIYAYLGEFHTTHNGSRAIMGASFVFGIGCLLLPVVAFAIINQEWALPIPLLNIDYCPWRLFLVVCGVPSLISAIALLKLPESPKFVFNQGNTKQTIEIIQWMHRMNSRKNEPPLRIQSIISDTEAQQSKNRRAALANTKGFCALMKLIWNQTAPLFMSPHLNKTIIVCVLQFGTFFTSHGMYMFFPGILNEMVEAHDSEISQKTACEIIYARDNSTTLEGDTQECTDTLDSTTYGLSFILEVIYALGFAIIGMIINVVGRLPILVFVYACCGLAGILVIFVNHPLASAWLYMVLLTVGFCGSVVNAVTVDLFPTNLRAMAVCISLMFGRLGSVVGANMLGLWLDSHCEFIFGISGTLLLGCGVLSFFIPNIYKRSSSELNNSISSR